MAEGELLAQEVDAPLQPVLVAADGLQDDLEYLEVDRGDALDRGLRGLAREGAEDDGGEHDRSGDSSRIHLVLLRICSGRQRLGCRCGLATRD